MSRRRRRRKYRKKVSFIQRLFRSIIAVVILSAFILGIALMVKKMAGMDPYGLVKLAGPVLEKAGISTEKAGEVAGTFAERLLKTNIAPSEAYKEDLSGKTASSDIEDESNIGQEGSNSTSRVVVFKAVMMGDSANENVGLRQALDIAAGMKVNRVFYLGDYTNFGNLDNLKAAKIIMDESGFVYYSLPGDRDLDINAEPADFGNYYSVFGKPRISVTINDDSVGPIKFAMLNNSANYTPIDNETLGQFYQELDGADYVILSQPLYHPLASFGKPVMGVVNGETVPEMREQANQILEKIRVSDVKAIIAGDQHSFDRVFDEKKPGLEHVSIGPISKERADKSKSSITLLTIYDNDTYSVEEVRLD